MNTIVHIEGRYNWRNSYSESFQIFPLMFPLMFLAPCRNSNFRITQNLISSFPNLIIWINYSSHIFKSSELPQTTATIGSILQPDQREAGEVFQGFCPSSINRPSYVLFRKTNSLTEKTVNSAGLATWDTICASYSEATETDWVRKAVLFSNRSKSGLGGIKYLRLLFLLIFAEDYLWSFSSQHS